MKNRNLPIDDDWATPIELFCDLTDEFDFDFDPCPYKHDMSWDGLQIEWGKRNFINPPYSRKIKEAFVKKAVEEAKKGKLCILLLPVSTSTKLFHEVIVPNAEAIKFLKGRIKFQKRDENGQLYTPKNGGMHDSMIVILKKE